ncbi:MULTISPECIES: CapA family protein [Metabacillus]|jgi:poly-gamma-glutamate capsule biosynthesis protein CapA/YwtB (metallophosphatase superfamily)|uniref:CapA family protein n=1 Tax=Metabacillus rhizolycopersici TaxID=2875709 RepID=A0ABS7UQ41_9BACI|nr:MULTISPECIES: CapA family protein [Metabacillus]MBZ5750349.1 CapA family protein [Metabacillus rhizolycopersici]MCM3653746.1 CapA family protein [Metabacillus litoralis]
MKRLFIYFSFLAMILVFFSYYIIQQISSVPDVISNQDKEIESEVEFKKEAPKEPAITISTATLSAIGDILIHDRVYNPAHIGNNQYDFIPLLLPVQSYLANADITVANQETMIGGVEIGLSSYPSFNSPYEVGDALKKSGVDIVTLANNHTLDRGEKAIQSAIAHWNELDMPYTGSYLSADDQMNIRTIEKNGIIFSFLAYTYGTNGIPVPEDKRYLVNLIEEEMIEQEILKAKELSDVVVVSLHFGNEYQRLPSDEQKEVAYKTANAGADIIIGHHPHVLQPMEWITKEDGKRTFVAYSLGNFLSGQLGDYKDLGGIMQIKVEKTVENDETTITLKDPLFIPTYVSEDYTVYPLNEIEGKEEVYKEISRHMNQWVPNLKFSF